MEPLEKAFLGGFIAFVSDVVLTSWFVLIPYQCHLGSSDGCEPRVGQAVVALLAAQVVANLWACVTRRSDVNVAQAPRAVPGGGGDENYTSHRNYCFTCSIHRPARSSHCRTCRSCVLKREHHCFLTGACIGHVNHRHFLVLLIYATALAAVAMFHHLYYLKRQVPFFTIGFFTYLPVVPVLQFLVGSESFANALVMTNLHLLIVMLIFAVSYLVWHFFLIFNGQTTREVLKDIEDSEFVAGWQYFKVIFGEYWPVQFLIPLHTSLPSSGYNWSHIK